MTVFSSTLVTTYAVMQAQKLLGSRFVDLLKNMCAYGDVPIVMNQNRVLEYFCKDNMDLLPRMRLSAPGEDEKASVVASKDVGLFIDNANPMHATGGGNFPEFTLTSFEDDTISLSQFKEVSDSL